MNWLNDYFLSFIAIFFAVDAPGVVPVYLGLAEGVTERDRRSLVRHSTATALAVALGFLVVGELVFRWIGITMADFLIAGGAILFIISIRDLLTVEKSQDSARRLVGVVPLAVPLMVGPAVLTTSLVSLHSYGPGPTVFSIVANVLLCGLFLKHSSIISRLLGEAGSHTLSKIANLLLAAIGIMLIRKGLFGVIANSGG